MGPRTGIDLVVVHRDRVLVVNRRTARTGGRSGVSSGTVTTLRDRSELIAVQRQLGATRNATDTLRAQTHEFDNQLHVISGLLQLAEYDEVRDYVAALTRRRAEIDSAVTARIEDPPLAALMVAKSCLAAESRVRAGDLRRPPAAPGCRRNCRPTWPPSSETWSTTPWTPSRTPPTRRSRSRSPPTTRP